jgi:hypothetical protein
MVKNERLDNKVASLYLLPFVFVFLLAFSEGSWRPIVRDLSWFLACSWWLNPDLDVSQGYRPGHHSFPFGHLRLFISRSFPKTWLRSLITHVLRLLHLPLNFVWRIFWYPFALLFTHRGVVHWPFIGTILKSLYIALPLAFYWEDWSYSRRLFIIYLSSNFFWIWVFSDAVHIVGDAWDSKRRGSKRFVPPAIIAPRGLFRRFLRSR